MSALNRVDKKWQANGLDMYSVEAILGTLHHYGVKFTLDEVKLQVEKLFPLELSFLWSDEWRGTGQFLNFHQAAAEDLWHRFMPEQVAPMDFGIPLANLLKELDAAADGTLDSRTLETRFKVCEALLPKVPNESARRDKFFFEMQLILGEEITDLMNGLVEKLSATKHPELCNRFLSLETTMFPTRKGVSEALAILALDETNEAAYAQLESIANDAGRVFESRIDAASILVDFEHFTQAKGPLLALMEIAFQAKKIEWVKSAMEELKMLLPDHLTREELEGLKKQLGLLVASEDAEMN